MTLGPMPGFVPLARFMLFYGASGPVKAHLPREPVRNRIERHRRRPPRPRFGQRRPAASFFGASVALIFPPQKNLSVADSIPATKIRLKAEIGTLVLHPAALF
jgi:hypothetical protein